MGLFIGVQLDWNKRDLIWKTKYSNPQLPREYCSPGSSSGRDQSVYINLLLQWSKLNIKH